MAGQGHDLPSWRSQCPPAGRVTTKICAFGSGVAPESALFEHRGKIRGGREVQAQWREVLCWPDFRGHQISRASFSSDAVLPPNSG